MSEDKTKCFYEGNTFYFNDDFNDHMYAKLFHPLKQKIDTGKGYKDFTIELQIHSNGGCAKCLYAFLSLIDYAKSEEVTISTIVTSKAYSCGSMLACAGSKGHRYISHYAEHLVHLGSVGGVRVYNDVELERIGQYSKRHFDRARDHYKKHSRIKKLNKVIASDWLFFMGDEIIENGLADKFIGES